MTDDPRLRALVAQWRKAAAEARRFRAPFGGTAIGRGIAGVYDNCADELEALITASGSSSDPLFLVICQRLGLDPAKWSEESLVTLLDAHHQDSLTMDEMQDNPDGRTLTSPPIREPEDRS